MTFNFLAILKPFTWYRFVAAAIAILSSKALVSEILHSGKVKGWESYIVAQSLANGEGYSFPSNKRWLYYLLDDGNYHPTAWVDPLYTYLLSGLIWLFGEHHLVAAAVLNLLLFLAIFALLYLLVEHLLSPKWAILAVSLLAISDFSDLPSRINNTFFATFFILLSAFALARFFKETNNTNAIILGLVLGLTVLACPSAQFFIPVTLVSILFWKKKQLIIASKKIAIISFTVAVVMSPWIIRNYLTFDEFIPTRNGAGQITFIGTVAIGGTIQPETLKSETKPYWQADSANQAIKKVQSQGTYRDQLEEIFQLDYALELAPENWQTMNEAQRDKWFLSETKQFIKANPGLSFDLGISKLKLFYTIMGWVGVITISLAIIGSILSLNMPIYSTLAIWVASYAGPFILVVSYFPRYRAPIEPLLIFFTVIALYLLVNRTQKFKKLRYNS